VTGLLVLDWERTFAPEHVGEVIYRGSLVYLSIFLMLRFILKREAGSVGISDLLTTVLISDAAQNAMTAEYRSVTDGLILVSTIVLWNYALDWIAFHVPGLRFIIHPPPLPLIKNGKRLPRNLRHELITVEELDGLLREQGIQDVGRVKLAYMESDGKISVVPFESPQQ
jgi:uncharacterized membrane protein YcaP (DUF421 family)